MSNKLNRIQAKAKSAALKALKKDHKTLLHMATGTGKTETAIKIYSEYEKKNKRMLWLTHKTDLVEQSAARIMTNLGVDTTLYTGSEKDTSGQVVVASVQSISKMNTLKKFHPKMFDLIIVDEAHHAAAKSWERAINYFKGQKLALTATPYRPDEKDISGLFGKSCYTMRFSQAQKEGLVAKHQTRAILTNSAIKGMSLNDGEYSVAQLEKLYVSNDRNKIIIKSYKEYARVAVKKAGMVPKTICFCINTRHAARMSKLFNQAGIPAGFVSSNSNYQKIEERSETFETFMNSNKIEVLCAVNILNEGTDIPDVNIGIMARPTRSNIIYSQQIGRLARINAGKKKFFYVLDFIDQTRRRYQPYTVGTLVQKPYKGSEVITKYVSSPDPVRINERIEDIMESVENFEDQLRLNLLTTKEELEKEADYVLKFGKYSSKVKVNNGKN